MRTGFIAVAMFIVAATTAVDFLAQSGPCDRACLEGFVDRYVDALVAHNPTLLGR